MTDGGGPALYPGRSINVQEYGRIARAMERILGSPNLAAKYGLKVTAKALGMLVNMYEAGFSPNHPLANQLEVIVGQSFASRTCD